MFFHFFLSYIQTRSTWVCTLQISALLYILSSPEPATGSFFRTYGNQKRLPSNEIFSSEWQPLAIRSLLIISRILLLLHKCCLHQDHISQEELWQDRILRIHHLHRYVLQVQVLSQTGIRILHFQVHR